MKSIRNKKGAALAASVLAFAVLFCSCGKPAAKPAAQNAMGTTAVGKAENSASSSAEDGTPAPPSEAPAEEPLEITEKMFVAQINDIYLNADDYIGKTLRYEGIFNVWHDEYENQDYYSVIRYGPGCCGTDANCGFEVQWDGKYPSQDSWVEVTGVLSAYQYNSWKYLYLDVTSLTVQDVRGAEYVVQ